MTASILDQPEILRSVFYPRPDPPDPWPPGVLRVSVPVEHGVSIGGRLYPAGAASPLLLLFHGNGEIAADYDELASLYTEMGITLLAADYRGYGASGGTPLVSTLLSDALAFYRALDGICRDNGLAPASRYVMGRSLGSAPAIDIASTALGELAGLVVESGFADTVDLLRHLGLQVPRVSEMLDPFRNASKMAGIALRTLILHGEEDVLIPPSHAEALYARSAAPDKRLVLIPGAGHNDLMVTGMRRYFGAIRDFVAQGPGAVASTPPQ